MMNINVNIIYIMVAFVVAIIAVYVLYAIIIPKGHITKNKEFQLNTKNILGHVQTLFNQGEYVLVELLATNYLDRVPGHVEIRQYLADAYFRDHKYNNSIKQCLTILKKSPYNFQTKKILGDCYIKKGMLGKALKEYEEIFEYKNNDIEVVKTLAELYRDTEQIYSSISIYNTLVGLYDENNIEVASVQSILAELNEEINDYPAAFEAYKSLLSIYPTDINTNKKLTELYIKLKNPVKAIETLLYMCGITTDAKALFWIYDTLVLLYVETEDYAKAIEYSNKLLNIQGSDKFKIKNDIATFTLKLNDYSTGISMLEELVMMSQSAYDVTIELAEAYIQQKMYAKALEKYTTLLDKATQKEAKNIRDFICLLYIDWAINVEEQGKHDTAFSYLDKAAEYNVLNPEIYYNKALIHYGRNEYNLSVECLNRALEYDKFNESHSKYYLKLSETHHELGNFFEEKKALMDLLKIDPKNAYGLYYSGLMCFSQHDTKNAESYFNQALEINPELIEAKYNLALIYENNNRDKAKELYKEILEENPLFIEAKTALTGLLSSDSY